MKKYFINIRTLAALLMAGTTFAACSSDDNIINEIEQAANSTGKYTMTVDATMDESTPTRALYMDGTALKVKWAATDQVAVSSENLSATLGTLTAAASDNGSTTLSGDLTSAPSIGDKLNLLFPRATWDYTGQTGVLLSDANSIEKKYDYALAPVTVSEVTGNTITTTDDANFASQQAIVKFILKDQNGNDFNASNLTISAASNKLVKSRAYVAGSWTPSACEDYTSTDNPYYYYLEMPSPVFTILTRDFKKDVSFGTDGCKVVDGKYIYRMISSINPGSEISIIALDGSSSNHLMVKDVDFTNGAYYTYVNLESVSTTTPMRSASGIQNTYGPLTVTPASETNTLTVALRNELDAADTYLLTATDGTKTNYFRKSGVEFVNGKYYEITVRMSPFSNVTAADLGKVIGADGNIYADAAAAAAAYTTAVAMIVYVGSDNGEAAPYNHGLALALSDANSGNYCQWSPYGSDGHYQTDIDNFTSESGLQYNATRNTDGYPAFQAAIANNGTAAPTGCSAWFIASGYQWTKMFAGNAGVLKERVGLKQDYYWSSSMKDTVYAWLFFSLYGDWLPHQKYYHALVRSCLAF